MKRGEKKTAIHSMVEALVRGDSEAAADELHKYLQLKTREVLLGEMDDEKCEDCGKDPCECDEKEDEKEDDKEDEKEDDKEDEKEDDKDDKKEDDSDDDDKKDAK